MLTWLALAHVMLRRGLLEEGDLARHMNAVRRRIETSERREED